MCGIAKFIIIPEKLQYLFFTKINRDFCEELQANDKRND